MVSTVQRRPVREPRGHDPGVPSRRPRVRCSWSRPDSLALAAAKLGVARLVAEPVTVEVQAGSRHQLELRARPAP